MDLVQRVLRSPGRPIDDRWRIPLQRFFGRDLSHVRIHTSDEAALSANQLRARAWAFGNHVAFGPGEYRPDQPKGWQLLIHEIVHVLQADAIWPNEPILPAVCATYDEFERQAEAISVLPSATAALPILPMRKPGLYRAVTEECFAPSEALTLILTPGPLSIASSAFGEVAERIIELDYLALRPGTVLIDHFFDNPITASFIAFLAFHNAHINNPLTLASLAILANMPGGGISRPDILTDQAATQEYYEIKPDSVSGRAEGRLKMASVDAFMGTFRLPYPRGTTFVPTARISIGSGSLPTLVGTVPFSAFLRVRRHGAGLLVYKVCVETDFAAVGVTVAVLIALIILAILAKRAGVPIELPPGFPTPVLT